MDRTLAIAIAGLALGLVNSAVQLAGWFSNRARIKIEIAGVMTVNIPGLDGNETYLGITVRNAGQRPTTINRVWLDLPPPGSRPLARNGRRLLRAGATKACTWRDIPKPEI
jgi:hypothetical protein